MSSASDGTAKLDDPKLNIKIKLAGLWASVMFIFIYVDLFGFFIPGFIQKIIDGEAGHTGIPLSQTFLLSVIVLMMIPSLMICLTLTLKAPLNRRVNIIVGIFKIIVVVAGTVGETWLYYLFASAVEVVILSYIVWSAWTWPKE